MTETRSYPATFDRQHANAESLTVPAVLSTETPVKRGNIVEVLRHTPESVDLSRFPLPVIEAHDGRKVNIGLAENPRIEGGKLRGTIRFGTSARARELFQDVEAGIVRNLSIGYEWLDTAETPRGPETLVTVTRFKPFEVSIVAIPADHNAGFNRGKCMLDENTTGADAGGTDDRAETLNLNDKKVQRAMQAERKRAAGIRSFGEMSHADEGLINDFIERGVSLEAAKERFMKDWADRVDATTMRCDTSEIGYGGYGGQHVREAMVDGLLLRSGIKPATPHPAARDFAAMSIIEISRMLLRQAGVHNDFGTPAALVKRAMSTSDLPALLENVANKALIMGAESVEQTHDKFCNFIDIQDFKTQSRVALSAFESLRETPELAEVQFSGLTDLKESYRIASFQRAISLSRQMLINDDLDALTTVPQKMGAAARRTEADLVYAIFNDNPLMADGVALFDASRGNLISSSGALDAGYLQAAVIVLRKAKDISGVGYLGVRPRFLLIPPELEMTALQLLATLANTNANAAAIPNSDIARIEVIVEPRLSNATDWFLLGSGVETIEVGRLSGGSGISFETENNFLTDAFQMKVRLDAGAKALTPKGMVKAD
jgi:hypothetical protein